MGRVSSSGEAWLSLRAKSERSQPTRPPTAPSTIQTMGKPCHTPYAAATTMTSVFIHFERLAFEVAVVLVLLAALGLTRLVIGLRRP